MDNYFTDDIEVLPNKLGISDPLVLKEIETKIVMLRLLELELTPLKGKFDFRHLRDIHYYLFSDIYDFAGQVRNVRLAKGSSVFCYPENILVAQTDIFQELQRDKLLVGLNIEEFIIKLAHLSGELIALHPFREGNGRATRVFLKQLATNAGFELKYEDADVEQLLRADISAFKGDINPLIQLLGTIVSPTVG